MDDVNAVALHLYQQLVERPTLTRDEIESLVKSARRAAAKTRLTTRLHLLATKTAWPGLGVRESIRVVLSEMDAMELGQDVPAPVVATPERKNPDDERKTGQRSEPPPTGQPRAQNGANGGKPAVPAHGHQPAGTGGERPGPKASGPVRA